MTKKKPPIWEHHKPERYEDAATSITFRQGAAAHLMEITIEARFNGIRVAVTDDCINRERIVGLYDALGIWLVNQVYD